ncbi:MAG TPA: alpha/beta fold hydrolase [Dehalococcoidia bacterium]|nr:alpha/beta fold hydrolase [Dehalococcoidia bacterium]
MTIAHANGIDIYYEEHGPADADPVLLIMGLGGSAAAWAPQIPALADRYHVIALDNRGVGRTSKPAGPYTIAQMAEDAVAVLDACGVASAHVIGASMGGMIAQELALRRPERVRSLVLACTTPGGPHSASYERMVERAQEAQAIESLEIAPERMQEMMLELFTPEFIASPSASFMQWVGASLQYPPSLEGLRAQLDAVAAHDTYDRLPQIAAPTLVIAGDADTLVDARNAPILAARIPGAELRLFPKLRHGFTAEQPEQVNAVLLDFLGRHAGAAAPAQGAAHA